MTVTQDRMLQLYESMEPVEGVKIELLRGEIVMMATPKTFHNRIVQLVRQQVPVDRFDVWSTQAIAPTAMTDRPDPDLFLTEAGAFEDFADAVPSELVLMVLEVISTTRQARKRDFDEKPEIYARGGIPVYVIVDPSGSGQIHVLTSPDPVRGRYRDSHIGTFGEPVRLPPPVGFTLDTGRFRPYPKDSED
jgi:Uma2 family endonuclease